jgi:hypothetical protein
LKRYRTRSVLLTLVGVAAALGYAAWTAPRPPSSRYFEADAAGQWREVAKPSQAATSVQPPPLLKPQPSDILARSDELQLDARTRASIALIEAKWSKDRSRLEGQLARTAPVLAPGAKRSLATLRVDLGPYSEVSRTYDALRRRYWDEAFSKLGPEQQARLLRVAQRIEEAPR